MTEVQNTKGARIRGSNGALLDVTTAADFLGVSENAVRKRVERRLIPFRKWGGRVVFLRSELTEFLQSLPGCEVENALQNQAAAQVMLACRSTGLS